MSETAEDRNAQPCPGCGIAVGDHTVRGYSECLDRAGFNYELPHEDVPGGPVMIPGFDGHLVGEVVVRSAVLPSALGAFPLLVFDFESVGSAPMERVRLKPICLLLDEAGLKAFRTLVWNSVESACRKVKEFRKSQEAGGG